MRVKIVNLKGGSEYNNTYGEVDDARDPETDRWPILLDLDGDVRGLKEDNLELVPSDDPNYIKPPELVERDRIDKDK